MTEAGLKKLEQPDFTASARVGGPPLVVTSEQAIPEAYWVPQPPRLDRQTLTSDLRRGDEVPGACLGNAAPILTVRTK
jgi:Siphovirus Gp157